MSRDIKTVYFLNREVVRTNSSLDANRAVAQCILHMQINHYGANAAEVYDEATGQLHAQVKRKVNGDIVIVYRRDPTKYEYRYSPTLFMQELSDMYTQRMKEEKKKAQK